MSARDTYAYCVWPKVVSLCLCEGVCRPVILPREILSNVYAIEDEFGLPEESIVKVSVCVGGAGEMLALHKAPCSP